METKEKTTWGGKRKGAGRPKGTTKAISVQRKQKQIRAFEEEWEIIKAFSDIVKYGNKEECIKFVEKYKLKDK